MSINSSNSKSFSKVENILIIGNGGREILWLGQFKRMNQSKKFI